MILVVVETGADGATITSLETLTFARLLGAQLGTQNVAALVPGTVDDATTVREQLAAQGVETIHHAGGQRMERYCAAAWAAAIESVAPDYVLAAGTPRGSEVLAHVAARAGSSMAANVVDIVSTNPLTVSRQVMGGAVYEEMRLEGRPTVITVAGHAVEPADADRTSDPAWQDFEPELGEADLVTAVVRVEEGEADDTSALTGARVVVGAGRGVGGADEFEELLELTNLLGGTLGVSRVVTSLGWRPHHEQIGQTGSRISPDVYIACGISGAVQHWAGCQSAKTIVAINTDADAPMVTKADYAIVGDLHEVVPAISEELRRRAGLGAATGRG
ncbi:electron transfer flavoprotein subunit alpha/FixB family protein [Arthrobacter pigmenti]